MKEYIDEKVHTDVVVGIVGGDIVSWNNTLAKRITFPTNRHTGSAGTDYDDLLSGVVSRLVVLSGVQDLSLVLVL